MLNNTIRSHKSQRHQENCGQASRNIWIFGHLGQQRFSPTSVQGLR
jgi:hypothetical protein